MNREEILETRKGLIRFVKTRLEDAPGEDLYNVCYPVYVIARLITEIESECNRREDKEEEREKRSRRRKRTKREPEAGTANIADKP